MLAYCLRIFAVSALGAVLSGCVPLVVTVYEPDMPATALVQERCWWSSRARVEFSGVTATVLLSGRQGREYVEAHFWLPPRTTLQLADDTVTVAADGGAPRRFRFPALSLVDTPIVNHWSPVASVRQAQLAFDTPVTRPNVWFATYVDVEQAERVTVTLPRFTVNAVLQEPPSIPFQRKTKIVLGLINC